MALFRGWLAPAGSLKWSGSAGAAPTFSLSRMLTVLIIVLVILALGGGIFVSKFLLALLLIALLLLIFGSRRGV